MFYCEWKSPLDLLLRQWLQRVAVLDHRNRLPRKAISSLKQHHMSTSTQTTFVPCQAKQAHKLTLSASALDPQAVCSSHELQHCAVGLRAGHTIALCTVLCLEDVSITTSHEGGALPGGA